MMLKGWVNDDDIATYLIKQVSEEIFYKFLDSLTNEPELRYWPEVKPKYIRITNEVFKENNVQIRVSDVRVHDAGTYDWFVDEHYTSE